MADTPYQRLDQAAASLEDARDSFYEILTADDVTDVPVTGYPAQPSLAKRSKAQIEAIGATATQAADEAAASAAEAAAILDGTLQTVATLAELQGLDATNFEVGATRDVLYRTTPNDGYKGSFMLVAGDFTARLAIEAASPAGNQYGVYVPASGKSASSFAWVRQWGGASAKPELKPEWFGMKYDGTTDDTAAANAVYAVAGYIKGGVIFASGTPRITSTVTVPVDTTTRGAGFSSNYANPSRLSGTRFLIDIATTDNAFELLGASLDGSGTSFEGLTFSSHPDVLGTDLTAQTINCFQLTTTFNILFSRCVFEHLNVKNCITTVGSCNMTTIDHCDAKIIGDTNDILVGITGGYTYGNGFNLVSCSDSTISVPFIEKCGNLGVQLQSNSKLLGGFVDLNKTAIAIAGEGCIVNGTSSKFNKQYAIVANASATDFILSDLQLLGNNHNGATGTADGTFAIRLNSGNTGWRISNVNGRDKTYAAQPRGGEFQNFIHLGAAGNSGVIENVDVGDTCTSGVRFHDPNGNISAGLVVVRDASISGTAKNVNGLSFQSGVNVDVGSTKVVGAAGTRAMTLQTDSIIAGVIQSKSAATLLNANRGCIGPSFVSDLEPATIITRTGTANGGAVATTGHAYPVAFSHGGTGLENLNIASMTLGSSRRVSGRITVIFGDGASNHFCISATIVFDGTTLTVSNSVTASNSFGAPSLIDNAGTFAVRVSKAAAKAGNMMVKFDGAWIQV